MKIQLKLFCLIIVLFSFCTYAQTTKDKVQNLQKAPDFKIKDVNGNDIVLSNYKGKKVLLTFYRNVGCPVCNFRFHELEDQTDYFKSKNVVLIGVYESTSQNMKQFLEGENPYSIMIPNHDETLYNLYNVDKSTGKIIKGVFNGAIEKSKKGKKLFKTKIKQDGNSNRIGADFIIDEKGNVLMAYYGKFLGDRIPIEKVKEILK